MKKKKKRIVIAIIFLVVVGFLGYKISSKIRHKKDVVERTKKIPNFSFLASDNSNYTDKNLPNKPTVFIYFNSDCDFCHLEAQKIQERLEDFKEKQLIFVSFESQQEIVSFAKKYKLYNQKNIVFLEDKKLQFSQIFDVNSIPYIVLYDKNRNFLQKFKGTTKIDAILKALK